MAQTPQECADSKINHIPSTNWRRKIVISGIAGLYPDSPDVKQLSGILYNKINPVKKTTRWNLTNPEASRHVGNIPDLEYFDAEFFKVNYRLCNLMDTMSRKLLEQTYQAIYDAGLSPSQLSEKKVGVYIGSSFSESEKIFFYASNSRSGMGIPGGSKSMFANRISYWLNVKGPSVTVDSSCSSSISALEMACSAISRGDCEAAIVGGANLCLFPETTIHNGRTIKINVDGKTNCFDKNAAGCSQSEAVNVLFVQKAEDALRIYADVVHVKSEFTSLIKSEIGQKCGFHRNSKEVVKFLNKFYQQANISPLAVQYVEAFGAADPEADKSELEVIDQVFCKNRSKPLLVGSVMSNIGYGGAATGISAITKVILGFHEGKLAANLHYETLRDDVQSIKDGRIEILSEHKEFDRTYVAVNNLSITGNNAHILLHGHYKPQDINRYKSGIPRLVLLSGRQESSVQKIIDDLKSRPINPEEHALLHNIYRTRTSGHLGRGFVILDTNDKNETVSLCEAVDYFDQGVRPLWFVYSGMGSQWVGMGKELMRIPIFAAAIERCHRVLEPKGINIVEIITSDDKTMFDNILHSFVGITAIQIGLTDVLRELEIFPDNIIGHSLGEIGCAYADGCFTAEETILCSYSRGLVSIQTPLIRGSMAAVGLGYKEISKLCPPEIEVACHNSPESSTISGPAEIMREFVGGLINKGIFAREVPCSNIAYHSRYIADAGPALLSHMKEFIKSPKPRSKRWLSTSIPQDKWNEPLAKYSSAEYHTNNLLNSVLFEETSKFIPSNAVIIEIAPHGLLKTILKRSLPQSCHILPLTQRLHPENVRYLLEALGRLSVEGFNPKVSALYPKVEFPVSTETPMLSHLIEWAHSEKWNVPKNVAASVYTASIANWTISTYDVEHNYLVGHIIRGKNLYPFSAALVNVWDTLLSSYNIKPKTHAVQFENVFLHVQPVLNEQSQLHIRVSIQKRTGQFEVLNGNSLVASGIITLRSVDSENNKIEYSHTNVNSHEIYELLHSKEYYYLNDFRSIHSANKSLTEAQIKWTNNWVTFLDGIIQLNLLRRKHNTISKPKLIRKLTIDVNQQSASEIYTSGGVKLIHARILTDGSTKCGGVFVENLTCVDSPFNIDDQIKLKALKLTSFSPNEATTEPNGKEYNWPLVKKIDSEFGGTLKIADVGDCDSLYWVKSTQIYRTGLDVEVNYAGINKLEVNKLFETNFNEDKILNKNDENTSIVDFSGILESGARVMGIIQTDGISSRLKANSDFLWPVPAHWSLEDAATIPLAYLLAFYILFIKVQLKKRSCICIHGGAGALGQALINIALAYDCEIFTTVSSNSKKQLLLKLFPQLQGDHIGSSQDKSFVDKVMVATQSKGCDIVISCVKGDLKNLYLQCCGFNGVMIDIAPLNAHDDYCLGMSYLTRQRSYVKVDFPSVFRNVKHAKLLHILMTDGIQQGYVKPLTRVTFIPQDVSRAFHLQSVSLNSGRILLDLRQLESNIQNRIVCSSSSWQLILSDSEIFALKLAERLMKQGAKKIVLVLKNPSTCFDVQSRLWKQNGVDINLIKDDIWNENTALNIIKDCEKDNSLESVFIVVSNLKSDVCDPIERITAITQKSCVALKYFTIVSIGNLKREPNFLHGETNQHQSATRIKLPNVRMLDGEDMNENDSITINSAVEVIERAVCFDKSLLSVQKYPTQRKSLWEHLLKIAGIRKESIQENASLELTLNELNVDNSKLLTIQGYLRDTYEIFLRVEDIQELTMRKISQVEKGFMGHNFNEKHGIHCYIDKVDTDELLATAETIFLPTLSSPSLRDDEMDRNRAHLCIVPGVEGVNSRFSVLCERLKLPALVLQPGLDHPDETVSDMAQRYVQVLLKKVNLKENFYLLGFESGVLVALEMAAILEESGFRGTVFCLGGSPAEVQTHFQENLRDYKTTDTQLQNAVLKHMYSLMTNENPDILDKLCNNLSWRNKIDAAMGYIVGKVPHSIQYAKMWIEMAYTRLQTILQYTLEPKMLRSQLVSLRPHYSFNRTDLSLQHYSHQNVILYQLQAPLSCATYDLQCAAIINQHLDNDTLKNYEDKNICETYVSAA